jgi:hypothetical protein
MTEPTPEQLKKIKQKHSIVDEDHSIPETIEHISDGFFLSEKEVEDLRNAKKELTDYGKQKIKELTVGQLMDTEKFQEEFAKSQVFDADKFADEERKERSDTVLRRYNHFYNEECASLPTGGPISMEHMQAMALECMIDALRCENMNVEYNVIAIDDIKDLIEGLYRQSNEFLERVRTVQEQAQGHSKTDLDAL